MRILLAGEDEGYINCLIPDISRDYVVDIAHNSDDCAYMNEINDYDVVVIDYASGNFLDAYNTKKKVQSGKPPVMVLSDGYDAEQVLKTYNEGADLCLPKKTSVDVLCRGIKTLVSRHHEIKENTISVGNIVIDVKSKLVYVNKKEVSLRRKEYDILEYLVINKNKIVSKEKLLEHLWEAGIYIFSNTVEVHIKHLRDKIEKPCGARLIKTVRGFGYRINDPKK